VFLKDDGCDVQGLEPFDFVHSYTVREHIERLRQALEKVYELMKPGCLHTSLTTCTVVPRPPIWRPILLSRG
jgi:2-polyprenyl-3-methyl-5-hydroxy-6-metoxy-1,4-benzoquinol methylase